MAMTMQTLSVRPAARLSVRFRLSCANEHVEAHIQNRFLAYVGMPGLFPLVCLARTLLSSKCLRYEIRGEL